VKIPENLGGKPLPKRLRNTLLSVLFCGGLFVAYYQFSDKTPVPPDTHITYTRQGAFRVDIGADGQVTLSDRTHIYRYRISQFALRRALRAFQRADFFGRNILAYGNSDSPCTLTLSENHQKAAIWHDCETQASELSGPVQALETVTRFHRVLKGDKTILSDYRVSVLPQISLSQ
jgi:hypothetical protein